MKVYLVDSDFFVGYDYSIEKRILSENGIELVLETCKNERDVIDRCSDADVLMTVLVKFNGDVMDACPNLKGLVRYGIGVDAIDIEAASKRGLPVCNFTDYCIPEVATHAFSLILALSRNLLLFDKNVRQGLWSRGPKGVPMRRASSRTLGLAGFGGIARQLTAFAKPMGYNIIAYDPFLPNEIFAEKGVKRVTKDELFEQADIISIHTPMTPETRHMIDKEAIAKMKDGVIIVNTARGPIICEADLIEALKSGKVGAAGLDVVEFETITSSDHPYVAMNNVILTPHAGYDGVESTEELHEKAAKTAVTLCRGEVPYNTINKKAIAK